MVKSFRRARALLLAGARAPSITGTAFMMIGSLHAYHYSCDFLIAKRLEL